MGSQLFFLMAFMTSADREFQRQERLVMHSLEVFLHLQDVGFENPLVLYQGLTEVLDHMARFLVLF
jgi:hypothetical protein